MRLVTFSLDLSPTSPRSPRRFSYKVVDSPQFSLKVIFVMGFQYLIPRNFSLALPVLSDFFIIVSLLPYRFVVTHIGSF